jgi:arylsulfatase A-like enzyme
VKGKTTVRPPNLLIVMTDHQRADTVLAEHPARTPNAERLAREGVTFAQAYCPSPHCCPARAAFHTGLYPSRSGVWNNVCNEQRLSWGVNEGVRLWSQDLREAGYEMTFLGKWHVDARRGPAAFGWRPIHASGLPGEQMGWTWDDYARPGATRQPDRRAGGQILRPGYSPYTLYGIRERETHDTDVAAAAVRVLPELAASGRRWCLFAGFIGPHDPYFVPQRSLDRQPLEEVELPPSFVDEMADKPCVYQRLRRQIWGQLSPDEVRQAIRHFWAYCAFLDDLFGQILSALDETGQAEETLVLFCSDHGDYCGDHGLFCKGIPAFRGAYHVPAIVRWPQGIASPNRRVDALVSLTDFAPTFQELVGCEGRAPVSGASLAPFLRGETPGGWRDALLGQCDGVELYYTQRWVQTARYRYVFNGFDFDELYDLQADPHELHNLTADPACGTLKQSLARRMWQLARAENDAAINPYITVGLAPVGPGSATDPEETDVQLRHVPRQSAPSALPKKDL